MKEKFFLAGILLGCFISHSVTGQTKTRHAIKPIIVIAIPYHGSLSTIEDNDAELSIAPDNYPWHFYSNFVEKGRPLYTYDSSEAYFLSPDIDRSNSNLFQYRVLLNGLTVLQDWQDIRYFADTNFAAAGFKKGTAFLGGFKTTFNNYLRVELKFKGTDSLLTLAIIYWKLVRPALLDIYPVDQLDGFLARLQNPGNHPLNRIELDKWKQLYKPAELDSVTGLPKKLIVRAGQGNIFFYLQGDFHSKEELEYQLIKNEEVVRPWKPNDFNNNFIWLKNLPAGEYQLQMRFRIQRNNINSYPFCIKREWFQTIFFQTGVSFLAAFILYLLFRLFRQKRKLAIEKIKKDKLKLERKALRSQLNPHFVYNALGSVRRLMLNNDIKTADLYLVDFSHLLRQVLRNLDAEVVSLDEELKIMETYIKLEQLRFHFHYQILVDEKLGGVDIKIPSLLIQPLVENAIKYGAGPKHEYGLLKIKFSVNGKDLFVAISDNGKGFDNVQPNPGFGLRLVKDRIKLLNDERDGRQIFMTFGGNQDILTIVQLTFKNWLVYAS